MKLERVPHLRCSALHRVPDTTRCKKAIPISGAMTKK